MTNLLIEKKETLVKTITCAKALVETLSELGVDSIFGYPGAAVLSIYNELSNYKNIRHYLARHEQAAVHSAEGYARVSNNVGTVLVTSGPGFTNTITGIANAYADSTPLVILAGDVSSKNKGKVFQKVDIISMTKTCSKKNYLVTAKDDIKQILKEAFEIANSGEKGPVVIALPRNILESKYLSKTSKFLHKKKAPQISDFEFEKTIKMIRASKSPLTLLGGGASNAFESIKDFVSKTNIPVVSTLMGIGIYPSSNDLYLGMIGINGTYTANKAINNADLIISLGVSFSDRTTCKQEDFAPKAKIVHIDVDTASISRNVVVDVPIVSDAKLALFHLAQWANEKDTTEWQEQIRAWEEENPLEMCRDRGMTPQMIMEGVNKVFEEAIYVTDVGQNQMWATQYLNLSKNHKMITSGGLGTMGFGFPAAIGAKIANRDKTVICVTGDGGFQMNMQEMATAVVQEAPVIVILLNNQYLGMVRQMQELFYDKRYEATCLRRRRSCPANCKGPSELCPPYEPDFVKWAESYGAHGIRVEKAEDIEAALNQAKANTDAPTVIEFIISSDELVLPMVKGGNPMSEMILK